MRKITYGSWLVRETGSYNLDRGSDMYVVLLDIKKTFDSVWIDGLMYRLFEIGIDLKLWKLIKKTLGRWQSVMMVYNQSSCTPGVSTINDFIPNAITHCDVIMSYGT